MKHKDYHNLRIGFLLFKTCKPARQWPDTLPK